MCDLQWSQLMTAAVLVLGLPQPAIYVASLAAVEKLRATEGAALLDSVDVTCGLSLGEYTALAFAGKSPAAVVGAQDTRATSSRSSSWLALGRIIQTWCPSSGGSF